MSWYVFNNKKEIQAVCSYLPDKKDLESRNEFSVFNNNEIPLEVVGLDETDKVCIDSKKLEEIKKTLFQEDEQTGVKPSPPQELLDYYGIK